MMKKFCENQYCENRAVKEVPVSVKVPSDQTRALCNPCQEAYTWGVQHGRKTAEARKLWILAVADRGIIAHVRACGSRRDAEKALIKYLRQYQGYQGLNNVEAASRWLREHDEYLSVEIIEHATVKTSTTIHKMGIKFHLLEASSGGEVAEQIEADSYEQAVAHVLESMGYQLLEVKNDEDDD